MLWREMTSGFRARFHSARWRRLLSPGSAFVVLTFAASSFADPPKSSPSSSAVATTDKRDRQSRAVSLHDEAKALYERGLYRRAIAKLEAAVELDPDGKELVYNLALIHEKLLDVDLAEQYYLRYVEMETDTKARERALVIAKRIKAAKKNLEADLEERAPAATSSATASVSAVTTSSGSQPSAMPSPMVFVIGGVALAAVGVGIGFGVSALTSYPGGATTGPGQTAQDLETQARSAHTQAVIADLAFVTSLVVGGAATVLYLVETRSSRRPAAAVARTFSPQGNKGPALPRFEAPF